MAYVDFLSALHSRARRDYLERITGFPKAQAARIAKQWGRDYWDGDRRVGYGGYAYDGRWRKVADALVARYGLRPGDRVLDVGCGKAFLLHDLALACPGLSVAGLDVSRYALEQAPEAVRPLLVEGTATRLPWPDAAFDLVVSINTLHNLPCHDLLPALREIERVGRRHKYVCVESWRTEEEKANLLAWQLTCETFATPRGWEWWFAQSGYTGDHSFIFFEEPAAQRE